MRRLGARRLRECVHRALCMAGKRPWKNEPIPVVVGQLPTQTTNNALIFVESRREKWLPWLDLSSFFAAIFFFADAPIQPHNAARG